MNYYDENLYLQPVSGQHRGKQKEGSILRKDRCQSWECSSCTTYLFSNTCDMVYVFGFEITEGMRFELEHAKEMKKPVRLYDRNFEQICVKTLPIDDRASDEYRSLIKGQKLMR